MRGRGKRGPWVPMFNDLVIVEDAWAWEGHGGAGEGLGNEGVHGNPSHDYFGVQWFEAELIDGKLCTVIEGDWAVNTEVRITARAHNECQALDLEAPSTRFIGGGTIQDCAMRIKDILRCVFLQQTGIDPDALIVDCVNVGAGKVKIQVSLKDKPIQWGLFTICISEPTEDSDMDALPDDFELAVFGNLDRDGSGDADNDGSPDAEEFRRGTNPVAGDTDGDGFNDGNEQKAGTNPHDANDALEIVDLDVPDNSNQVTVKIASKPGKQYKLMCSLDLSAGSWMEVGQIPATPSTTITETTDPVPGLDNRAFFQVELVEP